MGATARHGHLASTSVGYRPQWLVRSVVALGALVLLSDGGFGDLWVHANEEVPQTSASPPEEYWLLRGRWWRQPPKRPDAPVVVAVSHDSLTLTWTPPETTAFDIVDYDVQYRVSGDSGFLNWDHNGTATRTTITGLVDVTRYEVRVRAVDELDTGDWSAAAMGATAAAAPRFVDGERATREVPENAPGGLAVGAPLTATASGRALRYEIDQTGAAHFAVDPADGQLRTRSEAIYDHEDRHHPDFSVTAIDPDGRVAEIAVTVVVTDVDEPPGALGTPEQESASATTLTIRWTAPENSGPPLRGYEVEYRRLGGGFIDAAHSGTARMARLTALRAGSSYRFRVRAENAEGIGPWSGIGMGETRVPDLLISDVAAITPTKGVRSGASFELGATVANRGDAAAPATTLRYYRSTNATITRADTQIGTAVVPQLEPSDTTTRSHATRAPSIADTYFYGACVDPVDGESDTANNCSASVPVTVLAPPGGWRGLTVAPESECAANDYDRGEYGSRYRSKEDDIVLELGGIFGPYTGRCFESTSDTHIEHMVALHQAHHSGLCTADTETKRTFAGDLLNLTLAAPEVNSQKGARDAAGWMPTTNRCWFASRIVEVKRKYGLTVDRAEADALGVVLATCSSTELVTPACAE